MKKISTYPIVQAPMAGGIVSADFIAKVADFGMLASLASGYLTLDALDKSITQIKQKTNKAFQVNVFVDYKDYSNTKIIKPKEIIEIEKKLGIYETSEVLIPELPSVRETLELLIEKEVKIISTTFGLLNEEDLELVKRNKIFLISTVNSFDEAQIALDNQNSNAIVLQTSSAGGHKGGFLYKGYTPIKEFIKIKKSYPNSIFVASGGIVNKQDISEVLSLGFDMVQIGTGFLMTEESSVSKSYKDALLNAKTSDEIKATKSITGKLARGVKNTLTDLEFEEAVFYPQLHYATKDIRNFAKKNDLTQYQSLWSGLGATKINTIPTLSDYMKSLV